MAQIAIDLSGSKGLATKYTGGMYSAGTNENLQYLAGDGEMVSGIWNPLRQEGYIAPAVNSFLDMTIERYLLSNEYGGSSYVNYPWNPTYFKAPFRFALSDSSDYILSDRDIQYKPNYEAGGIVQNVGSMSSVTLVSTNNFTDDFNDMILYQLNGDDMYYFIASGKIHTTASYLSLVANNWQSDIADNPIGMNSLKSDIEARFIDGRNGLLYVLDRYYIHAIDGSVAVGANGRFDAQVLTFPQHYNLIDGIESGGKLYITFNIDGDIYIYGSDGDANEFQCGVYVWNKKSAIGSIEQSIMISGVKNIRQVWDDGYGIYCLTTGMNGELQLRKLSNGSFNIIKIITKAKYIDSSSPQQHVPNETQTHSSLKVTDVGTILTTNFGQIFLISFGGGEVYQIGQLPGAFSPINLSAVHPVVFVYGGDSRGFQSNNISQGVLNPVPHITAAYVDTTTNAAKVVKWFLHNHGTMTAEDFVTTDLFDDLPLKAHPGNVKTGVIYLPKRSDLQNLTIYCKPTADSDDTIIGTIDIYLNNSLTPTQTKTVTRAIAKKGYIDIELNYPNINAIQIGIKWNTSQTMGDNDMMLSQAILTYRPIYSSR